MDWKWFAIFVTQIGLGLFLYQQGDVEYAKLLWASACAQSVTAQMKATKS